MGTRLFAPWHTAQILGCCPSQVRLLERGRTQCVLSGLERIFDSHLAPPEAAGHQAAREQGPGPRAKASSAGTGPPGPGGPSGPELGRFALLLPAWPSPGPAHSQPHHLPGPTASSQKGGRFTPAAAPGTDQLKYQLSPATSPDAPLGIGLWDSQLGPLWLTS